MATDGILGEAVAVLICLGGHSRESARALLGRCTCDEARAIAGCGSPGQLSEIIEAVLDRLEVTDARRN